MAERKESGTCEKRIRGGIIFLFFLRLVAGVYTGQPKWSVTYACSSPMGYKSSVSSFHILHLRAYLSVIWELDEDGPGSTDVCRCRLHVMMSKVTSHFLCRTDMV